MTLPFFETLFRLRIAIARIGENDWLRWWNSDALGPAGRYVTPRVFRRAPALAAAHMSIFAARGRHDGAVPKEPLVHLFNLGEQVEGGFERWLIQRKATGWLPPEMPDPKPDQVESVTAALRAVGIDPDESLNATDGFVVLGTIGTSAIREQPGRERVVTALAAAYAASRPGQLIIPYFRVER